jgi:23S rRNA pseudouridine1911/1915/1917 synthase
MCRPSARQPRWPANPSALTILYEDDDLLIVDKPAGTVVHLSRATTTAPWCMQCSITAPKSKGSAANNGPASSTVWTKRPLGDCCRQTDPAHRYLQAQFKERTVYKEYLALVEGRMTPPCGRIHAPIGRHPTDHTRQVVMPPD